MTPNPKKWKPTATEMTTLRILFLGEREASCMAQAEAIIERIAYRRAVEELVTINGHQRTMRPGLQGVDASLIQNRLQEIWREEW